MKDRKQEKTFSKIRRKHVKGKIKLEKEKKFENLQEIKPENRKRKNLNS